MSSSFTIFWEQPQDLMKPRKMPKTQKANWPSKQQTLSLMTSSCSGHSPTLEESYKWCNFLTTNWKNMTTTTITRDLAMQHYNKPHQTLDQSRVKQCQTSKSRKKQIISPHQLYQQDKQSKQASHTQQTGQAIQGPPPIKKGQQLNLPHQANLGQPGIKQGQPPNVPIQAPQQAKFCLGISNKVQEECSMTGPI